jgi:hypothetical protein
MTGWLMSMFVALGRMILDWAQGASVSSGYCHGLTWTLSHLPSQHLIGVNLMSQASSQTFASVAVEVVQ